MDTFDKAPEVQIPTPAPAAKNWSQPEVLVAEPPVMTPPPRAVVPPPVAGVARKRVGSPYAWVYWTLGIGFGVFVVAAICGSGSGSTASSAAGSYSGGGSSRPSPSPPPRPAYVPPATPAPSTFARAVPASWPATSTRQTYTVPRAAAADLDSAKQRINLEKAKASAFDTKLARAKQAVQDQRERVAEFQSRLETLGRQIDVDRIYLDRSSQADVDTFNSNVNVYNTFLRTVRSENAAANELIDSYNALLEEAKAQDRVVNQLVDSYNASLRLYGR